MSKPETETSVPMPEIVETPGVLGGKPRIEGHRIGVHHVAELVIHGAYSIDDVASSVYPQLSSDEVNSALAYYYRHRQEIETLLDTGHPRDGEIAGPDEMPSEGS